ncbi:hypothetical protein DAI22_03g340900 [Oryza sativa Japonica Group]|nr:hypothetical protein DAI22_03g340900 [Oryza sativa Japonica Group]
MCCCNGQIITSFMLDPLMIFLPFSVCACSAAFSMRVQPLHSSQRLALNSSSIFDPHVMAGFELYSGFC